jgi:transposase
MYGIDVRKIALGLLRESQAEGSKKGCTRHSTLRSIATSLGIRSHATILNWQQQANDEESLQQRLSVRGRKRKLDERDENKLAGWVKGQRKRRRLVKIQQAQEKVERITGGNVQWSASKVSKFMKERGFSSQRTKRATADTNTQEFEDSIAEFQQEVQRQRVPAKRRLVMDEAAVYDNDIHPYCYQAIGSGGAEVEVPPKGQRDTVVACLRGDGKKLPAFYIHHVRANKRRGIRAIKGMNKQFMLQWIEEVLAPSLTDEKILQMDGLGAHKNRLVVEKLESLGLQIEYTPTKAAKRLSPCDNSFFHEMKLKYRSIPHWTAEEKKAAVLKAYSLVPAKSICGYFRACNLTLKRRNTE